MRKNQLLSVLSLFLLVPASITRAQTTKFISGMVVTDYPTQYGNVKVYLPGGDTLRSGQLITGTVTADPNGKNEKEKSKNWNELMKFSLDVAGKKIGLTGQATPFDFIVPPGRAKMAEMQLWNGNGPTLQSSTQFYVSDTKPWIRNISPQEWEFLPGATGPGMNFSVDPHLPVIGEPFKIYSPGNLIPTQFDFTDGSGKTFRLKPYCGSSYESFFTLPSTTLAGTIITTIKCSANDGPTETVTLKFNAIKTEYKVQDPTIHKGKQTQLDGWINGLPADPAKAPCIVLQNMTTSVVNMMQGNFQQLQIVPAANADGGYGFHFQRTLTGLMDGSFTISATLHEPPAADDPFRSQLEVLQTAEQYNNWADALKRDLSTFGLSQPATDAGNRIKSYLSHIIENIPRNPAPGALEQVKAQTLTYLRTTNLPRSFTDRAECTYEVYKVASSELRRLETEPKSPPFIPWEIIQWGLQSMQDKGERLQDAALIYRSRDIMYQVGKMKQQASPDPDQLKKINVSLEILNNKIADESNRQDTWVHIDSGKYKSEYVPSDYKHMESGPAKSEYWPKWLKHAALAGPRESWYIPESYIHVDTGWDKSNYISPLVKHATEEGPDKSHYVADDWYHLKTGPSRSNYLPRSIRHIDTGANKSRIEYDVPGVDKPIREWEFQQKEKAVTKTKYLLHNNRDAEKSSMYNPWQNIKPVMITWNKEGSITKSWLEKNPKPIYDSIHRVDLSPYPSGYFSSWFGERPDRRLGDSLPGDPGGDDWHPPPKPYKHIDKGKSKSEDVPADYVHADEEGRYESIYIPPDWKHASEGPYKSNYHPRDWVHISVTGTDRLPTSYIEPGYYHASVEGPNKTGYVSPRHVHATEGVFKTSYIDSVFHHASEEGPDKSKYFMESYHASEEGPYKSSYIKDYYKHVTEEGPDKSNYVNKMSTRHASEEGPDKSKYLSYDLHHEEEGPDKSKYSDKWRHTHPEGPGWAHASEEGPDKSRYLFNNKHASEEGPGKSMYVPDFLNHASEEGPDKSRYVDKTTKKHVSEQGPDKSKYQTGQK